ncbi:ABC-2 type transport system permease protein [Prauserella shujinwangii]|uniref:ABC-2 type transport system permease protein n=1 Tax=Prauserella shujinwangii TaxID=1453103 RepID=A0A2T0LV18_9PSEU|nr:hypothetical protein [Prauserella shujinwangii]PRX47647.1 ABC-2 type transport system permease protein [Prauserella shujinwangii]
MITMLAVERIKLLTTQAAWWTVAIAVVASLGFAALFVGFAGEEIGLTVGSVQTGAAFGRTVMLVLGVLAVTTEYHWGTIRTTFQAVPARVPALVAKAVVVGTLSAVVGLVVGFGSWGLALVLAPGAELALDGGADWRAVAGQGAVYLFTAVLGVGVGLLLRSTALGLAIALVWTQLVEGLVVLIPGVGDDIYVWLPFHAAGQFLGSNLGGPEFGLREPLGPLGYGAYFAAICLAVLVAGVWSARRRDA